MSKLAPTKASWNAADYAANSTVQLTWARELIAKLNLRGSERILDVGCGDGKITAEIAGAVPGGTATGVDASSQMIEFAQKTFPPDKFLNLEFHIMDARQLRFLKPFDVIFSNAALHWVDDHRAFLHGAATCLRSGGRLVVSCGGRRNAHDVFVAMCPVIRLKCWREFFHKMPMPYFFYAPEDYAQWLPEFGFQPHQVKLAPKDSSYAGRHGFAMWLRTTWLPYTQRVPDILREQFIAAVVDSYIANHPPDADGQIHVRMVRLEIDAVKV